MSNADRVWLNGRIIDRGTASVSPMDRGFLYGDGFFETTRVISGKPLFLDLHLVRLAASCAVTGFGWEPDAEGLTATVAELIAANTVGDGYLRISVSRGPLTGAMTELAAKTPTVLIETRPMDLAPLAEGPSVVLARSPWRRNERSPLVRHKCLSYMENILALAEARGRGADEVYFLNSRDMVTEGAISNLFWARDGVLHTPTVACGLLPGVTRRVVLDLCRDLGLVAQEGEYGEDVLAGAEEAFCTNSLRGIMPVRGLLDHPSALFSPGSLTGRIRQAYTEEATVSCADANCK